MKCLECNADVERLDNAHLLRCSRLTLQEYALRHRLPLDLLVHTDQINLEDPPGEYVRGGGAPSEQARAVLEGLRVAGMLREEGEFTVVPGEVRRLDLLLWNVQWLREYGFQFRQEYTYRDDAHRVVARNCLKVPTRLLKGPSEANLCPIAPPEFLDILAVTLAHAAELHGGYVFMHIPDRSDGEGIVDELFRRCRIALSILDPIDESGGALLRSDSQEDAQRLLALLRDRLEAMPTGAERFLRRTPPVTVVKELAFDAAHFITDHPAKCSNLHGGRYVLHVKVTDRIDPVTGCVVDYGYLKRVVNRRVIERFDHHTLNYAAQELAWRSSTEMLCLFIWDQLIEYLPGLAEIQLFETPQSWCCYRGRSLAEFQAQGSADLCDWLTRTTDVGTTLRRQLAGGVSAPVRHVAKLAS